MFLSTASKWLLAWNLILCPSIHAQDCKPEKRRCKSTKQCCEGLTCEKVVGKSVSKCTPPSYKLFRSFVGDDISTPKVGHGVVMSDSGKTIAFPSFDDRDLSFTRTFVQTIDYDQPSTSVVMSRRNDVLTNDHEEQFGYSREFWDGAISGDGNVLAIANSVKNAMDGELILYKWSDHWEEIQTILGPEDAADRFGSGVALSKDGSIMVVCAYKGNDDDSGYFQRFRWSEKGEWLKEGRQMDGNADEQVCTKIAMNTGGNRIAVNNDGYFVSVFDWDDSDGWNLFQKIENPFPPVDEVNVSYFGYSGLQMSRDGKTIIIGDETYNKKMGFVLVYEETDGKFKKTFTKKAKRTSKLDALHGYEAAVSGDGKTIAFQTGYYCWDCGTIDIYKKSGDSYKLFQVIDKQVSSDRVTMSEDGSVLSFESNAIRVYVLGD